MDKAKWNALLKLVREDPEMINLLGADKVVYARRAKTPPPTPCITVEEEAYSSAPRLGYLVSPNNLRDASAGVAFDIYTSFEDGRRKIILVEERLDLLMYKHAPARLAGIRNVRSVTRSPPMPEEDTHQFHTKVRYSFDYTISDKDK